MGTIMMNHFNDHPMKMSEIFGKDSETLCVACRQAMLNKLYPYKDCYHAQLPSVSEMRNLMALDPDRYGSTLKSFIDHWYEEHPEEKLKEEQSRKEWEHKRDRQFRIIYGIARRHGTFIHWYGNSSVCCCPDKFEVYKKGKRVARIYC